MLGAKLTRQQGIIPCGSMAFFPKRQQGILPQRRESHVADWHKFHKHYGKADLVHIDLLVLGGDGYGLHQVEQQVNPLGHHLVELEGPGDDLVVLQVHNSDEQDLVEALQGCGHVLQVHAEVDVADCLDTS